MISRTVQIEIDRLKNDGSGRRSKRARKATRLLRDLLTGTDEYLRLRDDGSLRLRLSPRISPGKQAPAGLLLDRDDDYLVAEALSFSDGKEPGDVFLLTGDTNMMATAKHAGLPFQSLPDTWWLPPESDERDKKIHALEAQLASIEAAQPRIVIELDPMPGQGETKLKFRIPVYEPLKRDDILELMDKVRRMYPVDPPAADQPVSLVSVLGRDARPFNLVSPPSEEEVETFRDKKYPEWLGTVEGYFQGLAGEMSRAERHARVSIHVSNMGGAPAENCLLEVTVNGSASLAPPHWVEKGMLEVIAPSPPDPPPRPVFRGTVDWLKNMARIAQSPAFDRQEGFLDAMSRPLAHVHPAARDRYDFYWRPSRPSGLEKYWALECQELRHCAPPEKFDLVLCIPADSPPDGIRMDVRIGASNLRKAFAQSIPLEFVYEAKCMKDVALRILRSCGWTGTAPGNIE